MTQGERVVLESTINDLDSGRSEQSKNGEYLRSNSNVQIIECGYPVSSVELKYNTANLKYTILDNIELNDFNEPLKIVCGSNVWETKPDTNPKSILLNFLVYLYNLFNCLLVCNDNVF